MPMPQAGHLAQFGPVLMVCKLIPAFNIPDRILVAIGGNSTHPEDIEGTSREQISIAASTAESLLPLALLDNELIITHGNGPVVGKILMRQALTSDTIAPMPLDICVAHSQGGIAYLLVQAMENALRKADSPRHVACLLTQVEIDAEDPALNDPSKPIGAFYEPDEAARISDKLGWLMKEDSGRGWRHVVPSPRPQHICDISLIQELAQRGSVVIAGGGGGIPVIREEKGVRRGIEAVIDKDRTSALMANVLDIKLLLILTAVPKICINFGTAEQKELDYINRLELTKLKSEGHFPVGSMGPKVDAALQFLDGGGERVIIAQLDQAMLALRGETGTHIVADVD
jgi:carbamate kinase